jgi:hypothetical protein
MVESLRKGEQAEFTSLWETHVPMRLRMSDPAAQKLEFYAQVYLAVFPALHANAPRRDGASGASPRHDDASGAAPSPAEAMTAFRRFLETKGAQVKSMIRRTLNG